MTNDECYSCNPWFSFPETSSGRGGGRGGAVGVDAADGVDEGGGGEDKEGAAEEGAGGEPGDGDDDERAGDAEKGGDEGGAEADDAADEGQDIGEDVEGIERGGEADEHKDEADDAQDPGEDFVFALGVLEHEGGGHGAGFHALDFAPRVGGVRGKGVAGLLGEDAKGGGLEDLEGDAGVAEKGGVRLDPEVEGVAVEFGLGFPFRREMGEGVGGGREGFVALHFFDESGGNFEGAEGGLGGEDGEIGEGEAGGIGMALGMLEAGGGDGVVGPGFGVGVSGFGFFAAAEFLAGFGVALFLPLIHLDVAGEAEGGGAEPEEGVADGFAGGDFAAEVDELLIVLREDRVGGDGDDGGGALFQTFRGGDGAAFIPEQEHDGDGDEDDAEDHAFDRAADAAEPGLGGRFEEAVGHNEGGVECCAECGEIGGKGRRGKGERGGMTNDE